MTILGLGLLFPESSSAMTEGFSVLSRQINLFLPSLTERTRVRVFGLWEGKQGDLEN